MTTLSAPKSTRKPVNRCCNIVAKEADYFLLSIIQDGRQDWYICRQDTDCPDGLLYRVEKQGEQDTVKVYWTRLD
jgi:hypothetical protein